MMTLFEYLYRDAGNFKSFGSVALKGAVTAADEQRLRKRLDGSEFFIAEQIGVPPLYEALYKWSDGPIETDHCWHEFIGFKVVPPAEVPPDAFLWGKAEDFVTRMESVAEWDGSLSPHFTIGS